MTSRSALVLAAFVIGTPLALSGCGNPTYVYAPSPPYAHSDLVQDIQTQLQRRRYSVGPADGLYGPRTQAAISNYQQQNGLAVDGAPSVALLDYMRSHPAG